MNYSDISNMVNINGQKWSPGMCSKDSIVAKPKAKKEGPGEYHKGWRVVGIPPGELEAARAAYERAEKANAELGGAPMKGFDQATWAQSFRKKPVRSKAYTIPQAATDCKELAERCGWLHVDVVTLSKSA